MLAFKIHLHLSWKLYKRGILYLLHTRIKQVFKRNWLEAFILAQFLQFSIPTEKFLNISELQLRNIYSLIAFWYSSSFFKAPRSFSSTVFIKLLWFKLELMLFCFRWAEFRSPMIGLAITGVVPFVIPALERSWELSTNLPGKICCEAETPRESFGSFVCWSSLQLFI